MITKSQNSDQSGDEYNFGKQFSMPGRNSANAPIQGCVKLLIVKKWTLQFWPSSAEKFSLGTWLLKIEQTIL